MLDWVQLSERKPAKEDADFYGCILIFDQLNGVKITGWQNQYELGRQYVTHWAPTPTGPLERIDLTGAKAVPEGIKRDGRVGYYLPAKKGD